MSHYDIGPIVLAGIVRTATLTFNLTPFSDNTYSSLLSRLPQDCSKIAPRLPQDCPKIAPRFMLHKLTCTPIVTLSYIHCRWSDGKANSHDTRCVNVAIVTSNITWQSDDRRGVTVYVIISILNISYSINLLHPVKCNTQNWTIFCFIKRNLNAGLPPTTIKKYLFWAWVSGWLAGVLAGVFKNCRPGRLNLLQGAPFLTCFFEDHHGYDWTCCENVVFYFNF